MRHLWLGPALVTALLVLAGSAAALPADKHLVVEADNGEGCTGDAKVDCFRVVEGDLEGFEQSMNVHVMLENVGSAPHNILVTEQANADDNNVDTAGGDAINSSETIEAGETANLTFTVPADAEGLYFWCDVDTHEALGMWMETGVSEASTDEPDEDDDTGAEDEDDDQTGAADGEDEDDDISRLMPSPGAFLALTAGGVATFLARSAARG